tara:strand:+ start:1698 stop:2270 length:573 start_codon:yes stop_codon:yes gene_type:complete
MTRKHWITKKEIKELYGLSDNKIALMRKLNLVSTKLGVNEGKGRKPLLYKKSMVNLVKDMTPIQLNELGDTVEDTREQFANEFNKAETLSEKKKVAEGYHFDENNMFQKSDIEAVVEEDCKHKYSYEQSVNHPSHYNKTQLEVIDAIEIWGLDFSEGNVIKYLLRAKHKNNAREDLEKALWYVQRLLDNL